MGAIPGLRGWSKEEMQHRVTIDHSYDIAMTEVTVGLFREFLKERPATRTRSSSRKS